MSMLLQKGGDFMTLIRTPFKKKRSTIAVDGKRSPSMTPRSARGSTARSNSVGSSVNSYEESGIVVESNNNTSNNIYADIDNGSEKFTNNLAESDQKPPKLPAANVVTKGRFKIIKVSTINELEQFEECTEVTNDDIFEDPNDLNCSKNNLLLIDDHLMTTSIDNHLNNIELINKNLDKLMEAHQEIDNDDHDDAISPEVKAEKKKLKKLIAEKIKLLKEARMMSPSSSDASSKESFKSRVKNIFPKFEKQTSQEDLPDDKPKEKLKVGKGFLLSFKKKQQIVDETEEDFEEIKKVPLESEPQVTDLDEATKPENFSSKIKHKFKYMITSKMSRKSPGSQTCDVCLKQLNKNIANLELPDNDFCVCFDVDELDDGVSVKNFVYKDVSFAFILAWACLTLSC